MANSSIVSKADRAVDSGSAPNPLSVDDELPLQQSPYSNNRNDPKPTEMSHSSKTLVLDKIMDCTNNLI